MNTYLGASQNLSVDDIDEGQVEGARILYLEGYLWDPAEAKQAFLKAANYAHKAQRQVALTLSDAFCVDRYRDEFRKLLVDDVDILFANEAEIMSLFQLSNFEDAARKASEECRLAVLTRSEKGCVIIKGSERFDVPAVGADEVVDTTGAGDLFAAGFLHGHTQDKPLAECGHLGALAANEIISHIGARPEVSLAELKVLHGL
jgi:sugar/nucleoside kinase (ribokinase family)